MKAHLETRKLITSVSLGSALRAGTWAWETRQSGYSRSVTDLVSGVGTQRAPDNLGQAGSLACSASSPPEAAQG